MTRDALTLFVSRVVAAVTTLFVLALVARLRPPEDLGLVALGLTLGLALAIIPEAGMTALYVREIARAPARTPALLGAMLAIRAITLPIGALVAAVIAVAVAGDRADVVLLVAVGPAIQQVAELARATFVATRRIPTASIMTIVENVAWLVIVAAGLIASWDLAAVFGLADVALVLLAIGQIAMVRVALGVAVARPSREDVTGLARQAAPFAGYSALALIALRSDTILIGLFLSDGLASVGAYYAASRIVGIGEYISESVGRSIYPEMAAHYPGDPSAVRRILAASLSRAMPIAIVLAGGLVAVAGGALALLYGASFRTYAPLLSVLAVLLPVRLLASVAGVGLTSVDAQGLRTRLLAVAVVLSTAVYLALIPAVGIPGAVVGLQVAWWFLAAANVASIDRRIGPVLQVALLLRWVALVAAAVVVARLVAGLVGDGTDVVAGIAFSVIVGPALIARRRRPSLAAAT